MAHVVEHALLAALGHAALLHRLTQVKILHWRRIQAELGVGACDAAEKVVKDVVISLASHLPNGELARRQNQGNETDNTPDSRRAFSQVNMSSRRLQSKCSSIEVRIGER